jgi:photosystem II stability/assembly factor-like uncharacterized protein
MLALKSFRHTFFLAFLSIATAAHAFSISPDTLIPPTYHYPTVFTPHGPGGGGYMYAPVVSPFHPEDMYLNCDMGGVYRSQNGGKSWKLIPNDELVSTVKGRIRFTSDPKILYAVGRQKNNTSDPWWRGLLLRSNDGGSGWQVQPDPTGSGVHDLEVDPGDTLRMLASEYNQLYFTGDGGATWSVIFHPANDQCRLGGVFWNGMDVFVGTNEGLLVSHDGGGHFSLENRPGLPPATGIYQLAGARFGSDVRLYCIPVLSSDLYAWLNPLDFNGKRIGIYALDYQAPSGWINMQGNLPSGYDPAWIGLSASQPQTIWTAGADTDGLPLVFKSTDSGQTWTNTLLLDQNQNVATGWAGSAGAFWLNYGGPLLGLAVDASNPNHIVITDAYVHQTFDGGISWEACYVDPVFLNPPGQSTPIQKSYRSSGLDVTSTHHVFWKTDQEMFVCNTDIGQTHSSDGGESWTFAHNLFAPWGSVSDNNWYRMVQNPSSHRLFAALANVNDMYLGYRIRDADFEWAGGMVATSADGGLTWDSLYNFHHAVVWIEMDPNEPKRLYASVADHLAGGIFRSDDSGGTWTQLPAPPRTEGRPYNIVCLKDGGLIATYSARALDDGVTLTPSSGVFYSPDGGQTWADRTADPMKWYTKDLVVDPHDSTQNTWYATVWGRFTTFAGPNNAGNGGLYKTTNRGMAWTRIFQDELTESISIHPDLEGVGYVTVENNGLFVSQNLQDDHPVFERVLSFPYWRPKRVFFKPGNASEIWVATMGGGIWKGETAPVVATEQPEIRRFNISPNPVSGNRISLDLKGFFTDNNPCSVMLTNSAGIPVRQSIVSPLTDSVNWDVGDLPSGIYTVLVWRDNRLIGQANCCIQK